MKNLMNLTGVKPLSKKEQRSIAGGWILVPQNCPGPGGAKCPSYCHCSGTHCVFNSDHQRAGQFCHAL